MSEPLQSREGSLWRRMRSDGWSPDDILTHFGVVEPPVDVGVIAERMGIVVHEVPSPGWDGAIHSAEDRVDVWLDLNTAATRKRFTLAHEIGHLLRDPLGTVFRDAFISYPGRNLSETRANQFAADLLMPSWMMHVYYSRLNRDVGKLAQKFDVSQRAMAIRIDSLFGNA